jgi:hypothetical protein
MEPDGHEDEQRRENRFAISRDTEMSRTDQYQENAREQQDWNSGFPTRFAKDGHAASDHLRQESEVQKVRPRE